MSLLKGYAKSRHNGRGAGGVEGTVHCVYWSCVHSMLVHLRFNAHVKTYRNESPSKPVLEPVQIHAGLYVVRSIEVNSNT